MIESGSTAEAIGSRLRWAREQAGLSQGQVASRLGVHRPTVSQLEAGTRNIRADEIAHLASMYDVREAWIVRGADANDVREDPRFQIAARELAKLKPGDLETILRLLSALKSRGEDSRE